MKKLKISGIGCILMDFVYDGISFSGESILPYLSLKEGDGGISPGKLVFTEELEHFTGENYKDILQKITRGRKPNAMNIGGPGIVSMIHAAQLLENSADIHFTGAIGNDYIGHDLLKMLQKTPIKTSDIHIFNESTPFTHVLSDPDFHEGHGERSFVNNIGAAWKLNEPPEEFYDSDICIFGGTALVPKIHDGLDNFLQKAKDRGAFTIVNTVYDFRNQKAHPDKPWPLGKGHDSLNLIDLLITDYEEALRISGQRGGDEAMEYFISNKIKGIIITEGIKDIRVFASEESYAGSVKEKMQVSEKAVSDLKCTGVRGDTTGCGDNFTGGVIYSLANQLNRKPGEKPDMKILVEWGRASGGYACFYLGGTYYESEPGEKKRKVSRYLM